MYIFCFVGLKWKKNRKLIQPYFHLNILDKYISIFYGSALSAAEQLKPNEALNITTFTNEYILEVLQSTYTQFKLVINDFMFSLNYSRNHTTFIPY